MQARDGNDQSVPSIDKAAGPARVTYRLIADPRLSAFVFCSWRVCSRSARAGLGRLRKENFKDGVGSCKTRRRSTFNAKH